MGYSNGINLHRKFSNVDMPHLLLESRCCLMMIFGDQLYFSSLPVIFQRGSQQRAVVTSVANNRCCLKATLHSWICVNPPKWPPPYFFYTFLPPVPFCLLNPICFFFSILPQLLFTVCAIFTTQPHNHWTSHNQNKSSRVSFMKQQTLTGSSPRSQHG